MLDVSVDTGPMEDYLALLDGTMVTVESDIYVNQIMDGLYSKLKESFNSQFFAAAQAAPYEYHHVFEWGSLGGGGYPIPLYRIIQKGRGKRKLASFTFLQSQTNIPLPTPESTGVSQDELDKLSGRRYKFRNKAAVMEYGLTVHITAKHAKKLWVPDRGSEKGWKFANSVTVTNPGGPYTTGAFTSFWESWWTGIAPGIAEVEAKQIERLIATTVESDSRAIRRGSRVRKKTFSLKQNALYAKAKFSQLAAARKYAKLNESHDEL